MMIFESEYGLRIDGSEFKIRTYDWIDENGATQRSERAIGRNGNSCAWFSVPPAERKRLESLGVVFTGER